MEETIDSGTLSWHWTGPVWKRCHFNFVSIHGKQQRLIFCFMRKTFSYRLRFHYVITLWLQNKRNDEQKRKTFCFIYNNICRKVFHNRPVDCSCVAETDVTLRYVVRIKVELLTRTRILLSFKLLNKNAFITK